MGRRKGSKRKRYSNKNQRGEGGGSEGNDVSSSSSFKKPRQDQKRKKGEWHSPAGIQSIDEGGALWTSSSSSSSSSACNWKLATRKNELYFRYYTEQQLFAGENAKEEWEEFLAAMKADLPTTFRITGGTTYSPLLRERIEQDFYEPMKQEGFAVGEEKVVFQPLPWYPERNAWYLNASRQSLRRSPVLRKLHKFLHVHTEVGNVGRQEAVSMIPPLFLDVQSHHRVLDMCAAPGSKTAQIVEMLHTGTSPDNLPTGMVVGNDVDEKRCYLLVHQVQRLASPCVMMSNYPAQGFPLIKLEKGSDPVYHMAGYSSSPSSSSSLQQKEAEGEKNNLLYFDRILCDVPCSGDGTLRKNLDLWTKWTPGLGLGLHHLQLKIVTRAARLLQVGGRIVYSTCSLNPIEDEAVVYAILKRSQGSLELVDVSQEYPELKRRPGLYTWKCMHKNEENKWQWYDSHASLPPMRRAKVASTCFPPSEEEARAVHLERWYVLFFLILFVAFLPSFAYVFFSLQSLRVYPHLQDTGGFFLAVLRKVAPMPPKPPKKAEEGEGKEETSSASSAAPSLAGDSKAAAPGEDTLANEEEDEEGEGEAKKVEDSDAMVVGKDEGSEGKKDKRTRKKKEEPFLPLSEHLTSVWQQIKEHYGFKENFPVDQLIARGLASPRISFISTGIRDVLWSDARGFVKLINTGVRVFTKHTPPGVECPFRLCQESIHLMLPYLTKRVVHISKAEFVNLLINTNPSPLISSFSTKPRAQLEALGIGCVVFVVDVPHPANTSPVVACGFKHKASVALLVSKLDLHAFYDLFLEEDTRQKLLSNPTNKKFTEEAGEKEKAGEEGKEGEEEKKDKEKENED
ncbi:tRNA (cytosine(34)-C(5))-methyltransferase [Balamuthia mandrillaris]